MFRLRMPGTGPNGTITPKTLFTDPLITPAPLSLMTAVSAWKSPVKFSVSGATNPTDTAKSCRASRASKGRDELEALRFMIGLHILRPAGPTVYPRGRNGRECAIGGGGATIALFGAVGG